MTPTCGVVKQWKHVYKKSEIALSLFTQFLMLLDDFLAFEILILILEILFIIKLILLNLTIWEFFDLVNRFLYTLRRLANLT